MAQYIVANNRTLLWYSPNQILESSRYCAGVQLWMPLFGAIGIWQLISKRLSIHCVGFQSHFYSGTFKYGF